MKVGDLYLSGTLYRCRIVSIVDTVCVNEYYPVFVVVEDYDLVDGKWIPGFTGLACDDNRGAPVAEDRLIDALRRSPGETWDKAILRVIDSVIDPDDDDDKHLYELGAESFARGGMKGYNEAMGLGTVTQAPE